MNSRVARSAVLVAALPVLWLVGACSPPSPTEHGARPIESPAAPGSGQPGLVTGADGRLYLSWIEPTPTGHALRFAVREGDGWSAPRTVAEGSGWFVNWADVPSMAAAEDGTLAAHWLVRSADATYAYEVWLSVSHDGGAHWSDPVRAHDDGTPTEHGFASLAPRDEGFDVVWLDGRRTGEDPPGAMTLRHALLNPDGTVGGGDEVDERVCDCCPTATARAGDGALVLAWRDRTEDEVRDIRFARLEPDGWSASRTIHDDGWRIGGCPVNGPALAAGPAGIAAAWFTMEQEQALVRVAFSSDAGRSFGPPVRVDDGSPVGRVSVVWLDDGSALVGWIEQTGATAEIRARRVRPDGGADPSRLVAASSISRTSGYPRLARHRGETIVAWTETGEPPRVSTGLLD